MFKSDPVAIRLYWEGSDAEYYLFEKNNLVSMFKSDPVAIRLYWEGSDAEYYFFEKKNSVKYV